MTEISEHTIQLTPAMQRFVLHWGDMGASWGANRSVAQIHALLIISGRPLNAEDIAEVLQIARSNVSNSVRDLIDWGLARRAPVAGDRRDHFEAEGDAWEMATRIVALRKAREIDPAAAVLKSCLDEARADTATPAVAVKRLAEMNDLIDLLDGWHAQISRLPKSQLLPLIRLGAKAVELLSPFLKK
jgi:DNA-binding transcriptional regulator GbsR (MarR family)